jgi:hypothetical protein
MIWFYSTRSINLVLNIHSFNILYLILLPHSHLWLDKLWCKFQQIWNILQEPCVASVNIDKWLKICSYNYAVINNNSSVWYTSQKYIIYMQYIFSKRFAHMLIYFSTFHINWTSLSREIINRMSLHFLVFLLTAHFYYFHIFRPSLQIISLCIFIRLITIQWNDYALMYH